MFRAIGRFSYRHRRAVIAAWVLLLVAVLPVLTRIEEPLKGGGFSSAASGASRARAALEQDLGFEPSSLIVLFHSTTLTVDDPAFATAMQRTLGPLQQLTPVTSIVLPSQDANLISPDRDTAYAAVGLDLTPEEAQHFLPTFEAALGNPAPVEMLVAGGPAFYRDIETVSQVDLRRAELIAFPVALIALLFVFRSVVTAMMPLATGLAGTGAVLLSIFLIAHVTEMSIFVLNLATMLGLGLAVDYSLFVTSRHREELARTPDDIGGAVERTVATAGRAVFFSGLTVLIGLAGLSFFDLMFLRSVGIAGAIVVLWAIVAALTLLPALLGVVGNKIDRWALFPLPKPVESDHGFWFALSRRVMAHPWLVLIPSLAVMLLFGYPFLHASISSPDVTILPEELPSRQAFNLLASEFGEGEISPFVVVARSPSSMFSDQNLDVLYDVSRKLLLDPRIARVDSITPPLLPKPVALAVARLQDRAGSLGVDLPSQRLANQRAAVVLAYPYALPNDPGNKELLAELRAMPAGGDLSWSVGGSTAEIVDVVGAIYSEFPRVAIFVVTATYLVLMVLFRSLVLPIKAILLNSLSILASFGALVWVFQDGHLSNILRFDPQGYVEASLPVMMFCVLFGVSMDYEVFLLSRVREEWDRTGNNEEAVAFGMQRGGRIITSAALLVVVVTASFVSAEVVLIKALGFGIALAVALDATIVRGLLAPATMRLMGNLNWWLPGPVARLIGKGVEA